MNFVSNAIKFTKKGSITLSLDESKNKNTMSISVSDTGTGIPNKIKSLLFKPFATFEHSGTNNKHGVGLGLVICRKIC